MKMVVFHHYRWFPRWCTHIWRLPEQSGQNSFSAVPPPLPPYSRTLQWQIFSSLQLVQYPGIKTSTCSISWNQMHSELHHLVHLASVYPWLCKYNGTCMCTIIASTSSVPVRITIQPLYCDALCYFSLLKRFDLFYLPIFRTKRCTSQVARLSFKQSAPGN